MEGAASRRNGTLTRLAVVVAIAVMMGGVVAIGVTTFAHTSLRLDEAQSLFQTNRNVSGMLNLVAQDVHVPLYHFLLHGWQKIFGNDIFMARMLSLVFFTLTVPAVYILARQRFDRRVALFASLVVAISPFTNWYGSEARMYSLLALITVLNQIFFLRVIKDDRWYDWAGYAAASIIGLYVHYFFAFVLVIEGGYVLLYRRVLLSRSVIVKFVAVALIAAAAITPWLWYVRSLGTASYTRPLLPLPTSDDIFNTYAQFIFGFQVSHLNTVIVSMWPLIVLLAFFALQRNRRAESDTLFYVLMATLPIVAAFGVSFFFQPLYQSRYLIVALPSFAIFLSFVLSTYPRFLAHMFRSVLLIFIALALAFQFANPETPVKEDYSGAVAYLNRHTAASDIIIVSAPFTIYPIEYYYDGDAKLATQPDWDRFTKGAIPPFDKRKLPEETKRLTGSYQRVWLVLSFDQGHNEDLKKYYDTHFERLSHRRFSSAVDVYAYKLRYDKPVTSAS